MKICGTIQKILKSDFYIDKFRNRNYNKRVRKNTTQKPDGRSGGARRKPLPNCRLQDTYSSTGA